MEEDLSEVLSPSMDEEGAEGSGEGVAEAEEDERADGQEEEEEEDSSGTVGLPMRFSIFAGFLNSI